MPRRIARGILFAEAFVEFVEPIATESKLLSNINVSNAAMAEGRSAALGFLQPAKDSERLSKRADKKRPGVAQQPRPVAVGGVFLLQRVVDGCELVVEIGAQTIHSNDDSDRDAGCDQSVFDSGGTGFVPPKL